MEEVDKLAMERKRGKGNWALRMRRYLIRRYEWMSYDGLGDVETENDTIRVILQDGVAALVVFGEDAYLDLQSDVYTVLAISIGYSDESKNHSKIFPFCKFFLSQ